VRRAALGGGVVLAVVGTISACMGASAGGSAPLLLSNAAPSGSAAAPTVTFTKDVAPIIQQNCQICHQKGSIGPMPLTTYDEVKPFAQLIRQRVSTRTMPPWHMDPSVGIKDFKNDISLSDEEIRTIVSWAEQGAPQGNPADMPAPVTFPDATQWRNAERFGAPDLVLKSDPYTVPEHGQDAWWRPTTPTGLTEPRWLRAVEVRPSYPLGRKVTHHTLVTLLQQEDGITGLASTAADEVNSPGLLTEWAIGKVGEIYPEGTGKLLLPGSRIRWGCTTGRTARW
jgi:hypothetical protein